MVLQKSQRWQDQYARPDWQKELTSLSPNDEAEFRAWAKRTKAPVTPDYDMRGFWLATMTGGKNAKTVVNANDGKPHFPDTFKTPLHQSFSGESRFADPKTNPPSWNDKDQLVDATGRVLYDERKRSN